MNKSGEEQAKITIIQRGIRSSNERTLIQMIRRNKRRKALRRIAPVSRKKTK